MGMAKIRLATVVVALALLSLSSYWSVEAESLTLSSHWRVESQSIFAAGPAPDCTVVLSGLVPTCFGYLTNESITIVSKACCVALNGIFDTTPLCLCDFFSPSFANQTAGLGINQTRALGLPSICQINASPSECAALTGEPAAAPVSSGLESPPAIPSTTPGVTPECRSKLLPLQPCLPYATGSASTPSSDCCSKFGTLVRASPICLCPFIQGNFTTISGFNVTAVDQLPLACKVQVPFTQCVDSSSAPGVAPGGAVNFVTIFATIAVSAATLLSVFLQ